MIRLDALRNGRESYAVKLRDFLRICSRRPNAHVVFFEGQDSKYYAHRIGLLRPELEWEAINSGGKENVLRLFGLLAHHEQYKNARTLYFIDLDFDERTELPVDPRVYVTPCYSVENLYVTEPAFRRILKDEFGLDEHSDSDDSFGKCMAAFRASLEAFIDCSACLNGWFFLQRRHEKKYPGSTRTNLSSINLQKLFQIGLDTCTASYQLAEVERITQARQTFSDAEAMAAVVGIQGAELSQRFRGKFQAFFLRVFLSKLIEDANSRTPTLFSSKRHVSLSVSDKNLLSELSQYADTPVSLREFIAGILV